MNVRYGKIYDCLCILNAPLLHIFLSFSEMKDKDRGFDSSSADHDSLASGRSWHVILLAAGRARAAVVRVAASRSSAVELDSVALAGDTITFASTCALGTAARVVRHRAGRAWARAVGSGAEAGTDRAGWGSAEIVLVVANGGVAEA